jgi:hypothetical protein
MFLSRVEREIIKRSDQENRKVVYYAPCAFSQSVGCLTEHVKVGTFLTTVSPHWIDTDILLLAPATITRAR